MAKNETLEIQNFIRELGEHLGLVAKMEVQLNKTDTYSPIYDVVWFLELEKTFKLDIMKKYVDNEKCIEDIKLLPIAAFEIEGAATSSKNQIGNVINLAFSNVFFKFVIVNNEAAIPEKDSYRRGLKIVRYFNENSGDENVIFLDWSHIKDTYNWLNIKEIDRTILVNKSKENIRASFGGESISIDIFNGIITNLTNTGLEIKQNYTPDKCKVKYFIEDYLGKMLDTECDELNFYLKKKGFKDPNKKDLYSLKKISDRYYLPKIDIVLGFNLPGGIIKWIKGLSDNIGADIINNPVIFYLKHSKEKSLFVPLIAIEIESSVNKHLNGGILNMWKNSYIGILVSNKAAVGHIEFFRNYGCKNVYLYDYRKDES